MDGTAWWSRCGGDADAIRERIRAMNLTDKDFSILDLTKAAFLPA